MMRESQRVLMFAGLAAAIALGGCASTPEMDEIRAMAEEARKEAAEAQQAAERAQARADKAQATADKAMKAADETNQKIDRMFKKSMYK